MTSSLSRFCYDIEMGCVVCKCSMTSSSIFGAAESGCFITLVIMLFILSNEAVLRLSEFSGWASGWYSSWNGSEAAPRCCCSR